MKTKERHLYQPQHEEKNQEKVTDKALTRSIIISVFGILTCMTCLVGLTWAWYSSTVTTGSNKITAASFDLDITVTEQGTTNTVTADESGNYILDTAKTYDVSLVKLGEAKTGFCLLSVATSSDAGTTAYYTDSIPKTDAVTQEVTEPFVFTVSGIAKIKFTPMWGKSPDNQADKTVHYGDNTTLALSALTAVPADAQQTPAAQQTPDAAGETKNVDETPAQPVESAQQTASETPTNETPATETSTPQTVSTAETVSDVQTVSTPEQQSPPSDTVQSNPDTVAAQSEPVTP